MKQTTYNVIRTTHIKSLVSWYVYERLVTWCDGGGSSRVLVGLPTRSSNYEIKKAMPIAALTLTLIPSMHHSMSMMNIAPAT